MTRLILIDIDARPRNSGDTNHNSLCGSAAGLFFGSVSIIKVSVPRTTYRRSPSGPPLRNISLEAMRRREKLPGIRYHKKRKKMAHRINFLFPISLLLLACSALCPAAQIPCEWTGVEKIIAIGDLHGDYDNFVLILKSPKVALVDDGLHWLGGKTHLAQTGDVMNRGDRAKEIFGLLMRLEIEAGGAGGKVPFLLGNDAEATPTAV